MRKPSTPRARVGGGRAALFAFGLSVLVVGLLGAGCAQQAPTTQPSSMYDRQERALHDPFSYSPDLKKSDMSVSGNEEFDKEGMKRDVDHVLNP